MHLTSLLFLGMSAGALSFPTSSSTSPSLDKRFSYGWIGAFNEPTCSTLDTSDYLQRPELHKGVCTLFNAGEDSFVGIDWGSGEHYGFSVLKGYNDTGCLNAVATITNTEGKAGDCVNLPALGNNSDYAHPNDFVWYGDWLTVMAVS